MKHISRALLLWLALWPAASMAEVVVTVKPLHSLVAAVMEGDGQAPVLLVSGSASPHTFQLAPSQVQALEQADVVFAIGAGLEPFLPRLRELMPESPKIVVMAEQQGMFVLPMRTGNETDWGENSNAPPDPHLWLDPTNAITMVDVIAANLSALYPAHQRLYSENAKALKARIHQLDEDIRARLSRVKDRPFIVFHDALQYFEGAYGLHVAGSITLSGEPLPGAQHLSQLHAMLENGRAVCVLREPAGGETLVAKVTEGTRARIGVMDPEGTALNPGPILYLNLMAGLANELESCAR